MASITRWSIPVKYLSEIYGGIRFVDDKEDDADGDTLFALVVNAGCAHPGRPTLFEEGVFRANMWRDGAHAMHRTVGGDINTKSMDCLDIEAAGAIDRELAIELLPPHGWADASPIPVTLKPRVVPWPFIEH